MSAQQDLVNAYKLVGIAYNQGKHAAESLRIGDEFMGAWGHADQHGYPAKRKRERDAFVQAFLGHLAEQITVDNDGYIVKIGK